jgi:hypothetical protein
MSALGGSFLSLRTVLIGAIAVAGAPSAMAEIPSKTLMGVSQAVITCEADSTLTAEEAQAICKQLVAKAQSVTRLPVKAMSASQLADGSAPGGERLVLHVKMSAGSLQSDRGTLALLVTPSRDYLHFNQGTPVKSEAQLARLDGKLVVQGPVPAFSQILGAAPATLHKPIRSDF